MNNSSPAKTEAASFRNSVAQKLSSIMDFHDEIRKNFQRQITAIDEKLEQRGSLSEEAITGLTARKKTYTDTFVPFLRINTFLMMVSCLEEWLYHTWQRHAPDMALLEAKGSIGRFKPVLKALGVDLSRSGPWMFVKGCQDVRSCLIHANGQVDLNRNPEKICNFVAQNKGKLSIESGRLVLNLEFLERFRAASEELIESVRPL